MKNTFLLVLILLMCGCYPNHKHISVKMKNDSKLKNVEITISTLKEKLSYKFKNANFEFDTIWTLQGKDETDGHYKLEIVSNNRLTAQRSFGYYTNGMVDIDDFDIKLIDSIAVYSYREGSVIDTLHW
jgi:hypothetical protein